MADQTQPMVELNDGAWIPQFGLGVFQVPPEMTAQVVRQAVELGYRAVDTASMYRNEAGVGEALEGRTDVFVTTKLGNSDHGFDPVLRAFDASAQKLRRATLDLYLIHWPRPRVDRYVDSWKAFVRLQREGRIRSIGVSNFNRDHLERIIGETGVTPAVNQIELHPRFQQEALRAFHDERGIKTESWSPLGRGALLDDPIIMSIASKHGKTPAQVVIRWHLDSGLIVIPNRCIPIASPKTSARSTSAWKTTTSDASEPSTRPAAGSVRIRQPPPSDPRPARIDCRALDPASRAGRFAATAKCQTVRVTFIRCGGWSGSRPRRRATASARR